MPCSARVSKCSGFRRSARIPACTRGCKVFTRPPSISGKPVTSSTGVTARPASRSACAVPPLETKAAPSSVRPRASSTTPVLSYTASSARRTGSTSDIRFLQEVDHAPFDLEATLDHRANRLREQAMLHLVHARLERVLLIGGEHGQGLLQDD